MHSCHDRGDVDLGVGLGQDRVAVLVADDGAVRVGLLVRGHVQRLRHAALVALGVVALEHVQVEIDVEARAVVGQVHTVAIADAAAGRRDARLHRGLRLGAGDSLARVGDLQIPEPRQQHGHRADDQQDQQAEAPPGARLSSSSIATGPFLPGRLPTRKARGQADQEKENGAEQKVKQRGEGDLGPHRKRPMPMTALDPGEKKIQHEVREGAGEDVAQSHDPVLRIGPSGPARRLKGKAKRAAARRCPAGALGLSSPGRFQGKTRSPGRAHRPARGWRR